MGENNSNTEIIDEIRLDDENDTDEQDDLSGKRKIYTEQGDPEIDSLHKRFLKGRLNIQPGFQRQFVWDKVKSSRLIESALLDIPIPIVYLSEEKDGKENVIDGQQRLTSFFSFIDGKLPDNSEFKLSGLKVFTDLNGKKFNQLSDELQDKITTYKIRVIKFKKESDGDLQFEIFARLNTGSVPLNDQELRNCVFRGRFNELLKELSQDKDFKYLLGIATPDRRMKDRELVLRFASFHFYTYLNYSAPIKKFLNDSMEKYRNISPADESNLRVAFKNTIQIILSLLDKNAFKRFYRGDEKNKNGKWEPQKFNVSLFDILMYSFAREDKNTVFQNLDRVREALIDLMTKDQDFIDSIELSTSSKKAVTTRFDKWRMTLKTILGIGAKEPRCFTYQLKQELFSANDTCAICGNKIRNIDDAAVDHIEQYWTGGKTIPANARLTHRYCNNARPRIEENFTVESQDEEVRETNNEALNTFSSSNRDYSTISLYFEENPFALNFKKSDIGFFTVKLLDEKGLIDEDVFDFLREDKSSKFQLIRKRQEINTETELKKYRVNSTPELIYKGEKYWVARNWGKVNGIDNTEIFIEKIIRKFPKIKYKRND